MGKTNSRKVYPLDVTALAKEIQAAQVKTGIRSRAQLLQMAIARGLPVLIQQLGTHAAQSGGKAA